jgi:hypothetical protein
MVPDGRPVSLNLTAYVKGEKFIDMLTLAPFTVNDPEYGDGEYLLSTVAMVNEYDPFGSLKYIVFNEDENV